MTVYICNYTYVFDAIDFKLQSTRQRCYEDIKYQNLFILICSIYARFLNVILITYYVYSIFLIHAKDRNLSIYIIEYFYIIICISIIYCIVYIGRSVYLSYYTKNIPSPK